MRRFSYFLIILAFLAGVGLAHAADSTVGTKSTGETLSAAELNNIVSAVNSKQDEPSEGAFADGDKTKLDGIETAADVTDATNVAAAGAVMNTGNETIAGVKTFSSFPVTPSSAPTTDYQMANKKYVDDNATTGDDMGAVNTLAELNSAISDATILDDGAIATSTAIGLTTGDNLTNISGSANDDTINEYLSAIDTTIGGLGGGHDALTLNANATAGGLSLSTQELNFRAATNAQTGYMTAAQVTAIEANTAKTTFDWDYDFDDLTNTPTTLSGYGITDAASTSGITRGASGTGIPDILGSYNVYHIGTLTAHRNMTWPDRALTIDNITSSTTTGLSAGVLRSDGTNIGLGAEGTHYYLPGGTDVADADIVATIARDSEVPAISSSMAVPIFTLNVKDVSDAVDDVKKKFPRGMTLTGVYGICIGGTNVIGALSEVDSDGDDSDASVIDSAWTITTSQFSDTSFMNSAIDANDYLQWDTTSVSGDVTNFTLVVWGYET